MRSLIVLTLAALSLSAAHAAPRASTAPAVSCANVAMPAAVRAAVALCESDDDCVSAEFEARTAYCAASGNAGKVYCTCAFDGHVAL